MSECLKTCQKKPSKNVKKTAATSHRTGKSPTVQVEVLLNFNFSISYGCPHPSESESGH